MEVKDAASVQRLRVFGSPTVQIDGRDIEPKVRSQTDFAFGCRMYGTSGTPPRELVRAALTEARNA